MRRSVLRTAALVLAALALLPAVARGAGEPVLPLSAVHAGLRCTVRSVVQGTRIDTFDAVVRDVVDAQPAGEDARILIRVSGPAVADTGVGPGFSGSPISCPDPAGRMRVAGAISESVGAYGGFDALATPIEQVIGQPVSPPVGVRRAPGLLAHARPLAALTATGLSRPLAALARRAAHRAGRELIVVPGGPAASRFAPQRLLPGASLSVGLSSGAVALGAIGTVTYRDGPMLWAFGHPFDGAGRRSLFLQDAYVYAVINNPLGAQDLTTYKLAAPGHDLGTLSGDGPDAIAGRVGGGPPQIPLTVTTRDGDAGTKAVAETRIADETDLGEPSGSSPLSLVAPLAVASLGTQAFHGGAPSEESGRSCLVVVLRERPRSPARACNRYSEIGLAEDGGAVPFRAASDVASAVELVEGADFRALHVARLSVDLTVRRGLRGLELVGASSPARVHPGRLVSVAVRLRRARQPARVRRFRLRVPGSISPGRQELRLADRATVESDGGGGDAAQAVVQAAFAGGGGAGGSANGAESVEGVLAAIRRIATDDGLRAYWTGLRGRSGHRAARLGLPALRDPQDPISGSVRVPVQVVRG